MRSIVPRRSAAPLSALFAFLLVCTPAAAQTAPPAAPEAAAATPSVQLSPLPATEQFNKKIDFRTRPAGENLDALVQILARSVGLSAVTQGIPETVVRYDFGEPKPFREVWDIVLTLNGLEYVLRDNGIVVVGPPEVLEGLRTQRNNEQPTVVRTYNIPSSSNTSSGTGSASDSSGDDGSASQLATYLTNQFPRGSGVSVTSFDQLGVLSVRASVAQQARMNELLKPFNRASEVKVRRTYALSYARANDIANILTASTSAVPATPATRTTESTTTVTGSTANDTTSSTFTPSTSGQAPIAAAFSEDEEILATPDPRTNSVIVLAPERVQEEVVRIIEELDKPEREVNVQVRIQEVTSDVTERLGIDLTSAIGNFSTSLFSGDETSGLNFIFDAQRAVSGFNLGAILDAFERQGLSRRVDDSNITVLNNSEASLQAGGTIFISIPGGEQNIERTIPYGVQIDLTPQIAANNEVLLNVTGRVEAVISETDDPNFLELSTRNLTSRVSLKPGQTVVLGGLLQNESTGTTRKVPGLGDVPIVGNLFSTNNTSESSTELLVIVTANVLE